MTTPTAPAAAVAIPTTTTIRDIYVQDFLSVPEIIALCKRFHQLEDVLWQGMAARDRQRVAESIAPERANPVANLALPFIEHTTMLEMDPSAVAEKMLALEQVLECATEDEAATA